MENKKSKKHRKVSEFGGDKPLSKKQARGLYESGIISEKQYEELIIRGMSAGSDTKTKKLQFEGTDVTMYPGISGFSKSDASNANNVITPELEQMRAELKERYTPIFWEVAEKYGTINNDDRNDQVLNLLNRFE